MSETSSTPGPLAALDYEVLQQCMHCGMCLPTCPTYTATRRESASPRGRIAAMRAIADGRAEVTPAFAEEMYFCLGCVACETACPAGVEYGRLLETARAEVEQRGLLDSRRRRLVRAFTLGWLFARRGRLRALGRLLWLYQRSGLQALVRRLGLPRLAGKLGELEPLTPTIQSAFTQIPYQTPAAIAAAPRRRVAVIAGCVQDIAFADVNRDTITVLEANGCEVVVPDRQQCCGSLHAHNGEPAAAAALARTNLAAFDVEALDAIISNAAGCGSHIRHYDRLLAGTPDAARAEAWSEKVRDISEFLGEIDCRAPTVSPVAMKVAYHEACHLVHAQKVSAPAQRLLALIPGCELVPLPEATWCCGSAGIYNITQPEMSAKLRDRKMANIAGCGATVVATANPGCMVQLQAGSAVSGPDVRVVHPVTLLAEAYRREQGSGAAG
jgi:glycolate oxidase iron-sulfur subunit